MSDARPLTAPVSLVTIGTIVAIAGALTAGCGARRIPEPTRPASTSVVLLPDSETRTTGRARVSNEFGATELSAGLEGTSATAERRPAPVKTMSDAYVTRVFGEALAALPPAPRHFTLYFRFESDELTDESRALVPLILRAVRALAVPEVTIIGHTDTLGPADPNVALGLKRANTVRNLLVKAGLASSTVEVTSHGEVDQLVKTPDSTPEPRNRRVEIAVK